MTEARWLLYNLFNDDLEEACFQREAFLRLGDLAFAASIQPIQHPSPFQYSERTCRIAEEALLASLHATPVLSVLKETTKALHPFGRQYPECAELMGLPAAVSVFPLMGTKTPGVGHLWVFKDNSDKLENDHRERLEGWEEMSEDLKDFRVFVTTSNGPKESLVGVSWQLPCRLALLALGDPSLGRELAQNWLVTGAMRKDAVSKVRIGNKVDLPTLRNWLIPRSNWGDWPESWRPEGKVRYASTIQEALHRVNAGTVDDAGVMEWPANNKVFFSFVSEAKDVILAAAILSEPGTIVLWHTDNLEKSVLPAEETKRRLLECLPYLSDRDVTLRMIPSQSVYDVERALEEDFLRITTDTGATIINITQGNKLMALAAYTLARRNPGIHLIYRDIDCRDLEFTGIFHEGIEPTTIRLTRSTMPERVNWDALPLPNGDIGGGWRQRILHVLSRKPIGNPPIAFGDALSTTCSPVLIGNSYPFSLVRRKIVVEVKSLDELKCALRERGAKSFWGHTNTQEAANALLQFDITPGSARPAIDLDESGLPVLEGIAFRECWLLSPIYIDGYRPSIGVEVPENAIKDWQVLRMEWR